MNAAFIQKAVAEEDVKTQALIEQARQLRSLPSGPAECGLRVRSSVVKGDRIDVAALKLDQALTKANGRIIACHAYWQKIKASREETPLIVPDAAAD